MFSRVTFMDTVMLNDRRRASSAHTQAAVLDALPAKIALIDASGTIESVNESWRLFADANRMHSPGHGVGVNYLEICESADGNDAAKAREVAAGVRAVLQGRSASFETEYPCHSSTQQRWFQMIATPLRSQHETGAVVMHLDISGRVQAETRVKQLNRVYAMLSGINSLIVHTRNLDRIFREACRIAVDLGGFRMAMIVMLDPESGEVLPVASAGKDQVIMGAVGRTLAASEQADDTIVSRAIEHVSNIVSNDSQSDSKLVLGSMYAERGVRSLAALPLVVAGKAVGVFVLYASMADFFHGEEMTLLTALAGDIAFAIDHFDKGQRLDYLGSYDALTGLANQTLFLERLEAQLSLAHDGHQRIAVVVLDIQRFNAINEALGRSVGDALLKQIAHRLVAVGGNPARFARLDADHFAVVATYFVDVDQIGRYVDQRLQATFGAPFRHGEIDLRISPKAGIALFPDDGVDAATLLQNAAVALKKAKGSADRYVFFNEAMTAQLVERLSLEGRLRKALDNDEFVLHYQPKMSLATGLVVGAEALLRWNDPEAGLVAPLEFIPILEETGLIHEVGRWVMRKAIADYLGWRDAGLTAVRIAVNVSSLQLRDRRFSALLMEALSADPDAAHGLELELTESLVMEDVERSRELLLTIRAIGVCVAIDDFGTGYSSLSYLAKLPVDALKIDRAFVSEMTTGADGLALVSTIVHLAHSLKLKVVAEGVETEEQAQLLKLLHCDEMQGFLFSPPVPREVFEAKFLGRG